MGRIDVILAIVVPATFLNMHRRASPNSANARGWLSLRDCFTEFDFGVSQ